MGKASRSRANTGAGNSKQAQQAERAVRSWFSRTGVVSASNQDQLWSNMAHQIGIDAVEQIQRSIEEPGGRDIYELMYADVETARATATLMAPLTREWLRTWASTELPDGPVLDLGCGWGFSTCFYAAARPDQRVVGVDVSPQAVQCGRALAKELGVTNVEFITCTAADLQLGELFSVITSTLLLVEAEPDRQDRHFDAFATLPLLADQLESQPTRLAKTAADHLEETGTYLSMERLPDVIAAASWLGSLAGAGLGIDWNRSNHLSAVLPLTDRETFRVFAVGHRQSQPSLDDFLAWETSTEAVAPELEDEVWVADHDSVAFIDGVHFDVQDSHGTGQTRFYLLDLGDALAVYQTTSRGWREVIGTVEPERRDDLVAQFEQQMELAAQAPDIVGQRRLSPSDLEAITGATNG